MKGEEGDVKSQSVMIRLWWWGGKGWRMGRCRGGCLGKRG